MSTTTTGPHILAYTYPASSHIIPLLDLTRQLLTRGLTVTVLVTPNYLTLLQPLLSIHPSSLHPLVLPAAQPQPSWNSRMDKDRAIRDLHYPLLINWFHSHPSPPVAIVSDFFLGWTHHLAKELGIPRVVFSPSGAFALSILYSLWRDVPKIDDDINFPKIPHSPIFPWRQITAHYTNGKEGEPNWEFSRSCILDDIASWGLIFNSFAELERVYVDHLRTELGHDRVWAVGPLLPLEDDVAGFNNRGGSSSVPCDQVMSWLDARPDNSIVYVCFGSRTSLNTKQIEVLASALEISGVQFILCVRNGSDEGRVDDDRGEIPDGFEDRVEEGVTAGKVMLTWPMGADQYTNAKLLVDQLGVGIRVAEDTENIPESIEMARLLVESVSVTRPERVRVKELSGAALGAIRGGSSDKDLDGFVKLLPRELNL
ncbi:udp-glycosyltransferase 89b2 [Fagus crenata]